MEKKSTKENRMRIGDWVKVRKIGIDGAYQIIDWDDHGRITVEQNDDGYKHRIKVEIEELVKL